MCVKFLISINHTCGINDKRLYNFLIETPNLIEYYSKSQYCFMKVEHILMSKARAVLTYMCIGGDHKKKIE